AQWHLRRHWQNSGFGEYRIEQATATGVVGKDVSRLDGARTRNADEFADGPHLHCRVHGDGRRLAVFAVGDADRYGGLGAEPLAHLWLQRPLDSEVVTIHCLMRGSRACAFSRYCLARA